MKAQCSNGAIPRPKSFLFSSAAITSVVLSTLFVWFIDTMARSDSSRACVSALWLWAFADRPRSRDVTCKTEGQDGVAVSLLVGLFHSLQHAGLTPRTLINAVIVHQVKSRQNQLSGNRLQGTWTQLVVD